MAETRDELQKKIDQLFDFGGREGGKRKRPTALWTPKLKNSGQLENSGAGQKRYNAKIVKAHSPDLIHRRGTERGSTPQEVTLQL